VPALLGLVRLRTVRVDRVDQLQPTLVRSFGVSWVAAFTRICSASATLSTGSVDGRSSRVLIMLATCSEQIDPARTAPAVTGNCGTSTSPLTAVRVPNAPTASTRRLDAPGDNRSIPCNRSANPRAPSTPGRPRRSSSGNTSRSNPSRRRRSVSNPRTSANISASEHRLIRPARTESR